MTKQDVINAAISIVEEMSGELVPRDTGNMAFNALTINVNNDMIDIFVNPAIAPYVLYTNEPWLSKRWHRKKNPNEGWWQRFAAEFARRLATKLRGDLQ